HGDRFKPARNGAGSWTGSSGCGAAGDLDRSAHTSAGGNVFACNERVHNRRGMLLGNLQF
ncbi:MAG TPA: hypothetical protein VI750_01820, partial [Pyrinomonadaceae bacterium]|nr:hypothetical protein [Pyrinomonadaceae bacterium]